MRTIPAGVTGRRAEARRSFEQARLFLEARRDQDPTDPRVAAALGLVYAGLGRRAEALAAAARAVELVPISKDADWGPSFVYYQARTLIALGEKEAALDRLELLRKHGGRSPAELRLEPWWDPLRGEPRFQRLVQAR